MASLEALARSYRAKKAEVAKLRRKSEDSLKNTLSLKRRSSSGLVSLERKKESLARKISHVAQLLNQFHAQRESIARLKVAAEERLKREQDSQDNTRQQIEYGPPEEKAGAQERLRYIGEKLTELHAEMKEREAAEARLERQIIDLEKEKARLDSQLKKQTHAKPGLIEQLKSSEKAELVLRPRVQSLIKREEMAVKALKTMEQKLAEVIAKRMKAKRKLQRAKRAAKLKAARRARMKARKAKKRIARKKTRKIKTRRVKRTVTRKVPKRKAAKRRTAKRTKKTRSRRRR